MIKDAIVNYFQTQQAIVISNLELAKGTHDIEALHDLRVGVKRLKALYQILEPISDGIFEYKVHFEDIRNLFKTVGALRDLQVQSQLFANYAESIPESEVIGFYQYLQQCHEKEAKIIDVALHRFNPEVMNDSLKDIALFLDQKSDKKGIKQVLKHLKKRLKQIEKLRKIKHDEEKIHEMRTRVKQVVYIVEVMKLMAPDLEILPNFDLVKKAGESLGLWHDHVVLAAQIEKFLKTDVSPHAAYRKLLKTMKKEEKRLLEKARKRLSS